MKGTNTHLLKPDFWKILILLIIALPVILQLLPSIFPGIEHKVSEISLHVEKGLFLFPPKFSFLNSWINFSINIKDFGMIFIIFCGIEDCGGWYGLIKALSYPLFFIVSYVFSCVVLWSWNKAFGYLGKHSEVYKTIVLISLLFLLFVFGILLPAISYNFINIEKHTPVTLNKSEAFSRGFIIQELNIRNNFFLPVQYKLPDITICANDIDKKVSIEGYSTAYRYDNSKYVTDQDAFRRNVISLNPGEEKELYLETFLGFMGYKKEIDELLLLSHIGMDNWEYCPKLTEKDISKAERIKLDTG